MRLLPLLRLVRVSALPSALADVFGGMALVVAVSGGVELARLPWLLLATTGIYLGGMASNDVLHAAKDARLGKPRPLITRELTRQAALNATALLYSVGLVGALVAGCAAPALLLVALTLTYNWLARDTANRARALSGVAVIAACRGLHVLLPLLAHGADLNATAWLFAGSVFVYIALVTVISLFEDTGGGRVAAGVVSAAYVPVVLGLPLATIAGPGDSNLIRGVLAPLLICTALLWSLWRALDAARADPSPRNFGMAVGAGLRGECLLMAAFGLAIAPHQPWWGLVALALYPTGRFLARWVSPT